MCTYQECLVYALCSLENWTLLLTLFLICQSKIKFPIMEALCGIHDTLGVFHKTTSCFSLTSYILSASSSLLTQILFFHSLFVTVFTTSSPTFFIHIIVMVPFHRNPGYLLIFVGQSRAVTVVIDKPSRTSFNWHSSQVS